MKDTLASLPSTTTLLRHMVLLQDLPRGRERVQHEDLNEEAARRGQKNLTRIAIGVFSMVRQLNRR